MKKLIVLSFFGVIAFCQTANIYTVPDKDAEEGRQIYNAMLKANKAWEDWKDKIGKKLMPDSELTFKMSQRNIFWTRPHFNFSPDFKHAVIDGKMFDSHFIKE